MTRFALVTLCPTLASKAPLSGQFRVPSCAMVLQRGAHAAGQAAQQQGQQTKLLCVISWATQGEGIIVQPVYPGTGGHPLALLLLTRSRICTVLWQLCPSDFLSLSYRQRFQKCAGAAPAVQHCLSVGYVQLFKEAWCTRSQEVSQKQNTLTSSLHLSITFLTCSVSGACRFSNGWFSFSSYL